VGAAGRDPVAPANDEPAVVAEGLAHEDVLPAGARHQRPELRERVRAEQSVDAADDPDREEGPEGGKLRSDLPRSAEDAGADDVADRDRESEGQAEDLQQPRALNQSHKVYSAERRTESSVGAAALGSAPEGGRG